MKSLLPACAAALVIGSLLLAQDSPPAVTAEQNRQWADQAIRLAAAEGKAYELRLGSEDGPLLELAEQYGERTSEGVRLRINLSHQELANVIGSTRETVTVVLGELQAEGLISVGRRKIVIRQPDGLAGSVHRAFPKPVGRTTRPATASGS